MSAERCLWRNLGSELNHLSSATEQGKSLLCSPYSAGKDGREHNALAALSSDKIDNVEHAISEFKLGRLLNENRNALSHANTPAQTDSAIPQGRVRKLNAGCPTLLKLASTIASRPVSHRQARRAGTAFAPVTVSAHNFALEL